MCAGSSMITCLHPRSQPEGRTQWDPAAKTEAMGDSFGGTHSVRPSRRRCPAGPADAAAISGGAECAHRLRTGLHCVKAHSKSLPSADLVVLIHIYTC